MTDHREALARLVAQGSGVQFSRNEGFRHWRIAAAILASDWFALFQPNSVFTSIRPNAAGTKVIYTDVCGNLVTCWAEDWTSPARRALTAAALRARAAKDEANGR